MTVKGVTPAAEAWIQHLQLPKPSDQNTIRRCVVEYTKSKGIGGYLTYLCMRIWNAVIIFFGGCSSWQRASAVIREQLLTKAIEIAKENKLNFFGSAMFNIHTASSMSVAEDFLDHCVRLNARPNIKDVEELKTANYFKMQIAGLRGFASKMAECDIFVKKDTAISKGIENYFKENPNEYWSLV